MRRRDDGERGVGLRRRAQSGANSWRAVEGVTTDRRNSKRVKGKVRSTCDTGMPVRNGTLGTDRTTTTKAASAKTTGYEKQQE